MKKLILLCGISLMSLPALGSMQKTAVTDSPLVKVEWQSPENYQDIRPAQELRSAFHRRTLARFDRIFERLSEQLPPGYRWEITVTNVDLAGEVLPTQGMGGGMIRIVQPIFFPQMALSFKIIDSNNAVVLEEQTEIKDMNFSNRIVRARMNEPLHFERQMLERWFRQDIMARLPSSQ